MTHDNRDPSEWEHLKGWNAPNEDEIPEAGLQNLLRHLLPLHWATSVPQDGHMS
ncbi:hypothetical protein PDE_07028 [Penicillium oxalicum 114-2]|uniref:Uncharacterized protein n=1 Tax=Penicillium oxalicum (strain 114-2 / CGMCC 5302) TaxID=933388 RepID=S7ZNV7_PENO1|nr:hypothetical protein PDE_07028 [Penicillium oxalicum 114-2]